jgi:hypothetical protein
MSSVIRFYGEVIGTAAHNPVDLCRPRAVDLRTLPRRS